jgi:hypothetical protein
MDADKLKQLKEKYGEIYEVEYGDQKFYFHKPTRPTFKRYYDKLLDSVYDAACVLVLDLVIEPAQEAVAKFIEQDPGFPIKAVRELTGFFGLATIQSRKI